MESHIADMQTKEFNDAARKQFNIDMYENDPKRAYQKQRRVRVTHAA